MFEKLKDVQVKTLKCFQKLWIDVNVFSFTHFFTEVEGRFLVGMRLCLSPTVSKSCFMKMIFMEWIIGREMFLTLLYNPFHFKFIGDPRTRLDRSNSNYAKEIVSCSYGLIFIIGFMFIIGVKFIMEPIYDIGLDVVFYRQPKATLILFCDDTLLHVCHGKGAVASDLACDCLSN